MRKCELKEVTGKTLREWYEWLVKEGAGCCSINFASSDKYRYCVCMGWRSGYGPAEDEKWFDEKGVLRRAWVPPVEPSEEDDGWRICWKIGRQTHNNIMQCDYDIDFEMPYVTEKMAEENPGMAEGTVDDTEESIELKWAKVQAKGRNGSIDKIVLGAPVGYKSWNDLARRIRKCARRVWRDWKGFDD